MNPEMEIATDEKALQVNLDSTKYGTFAEIGAGQEVARRFFRVGGAAGTVAKTMSAYDMTFSDAIYGPADRYVSHVRLLDVTHVDQQEALGVIGVNLLYGAFYHRQPEKLIASLQENLALGRVEVDMIKFSGPVFQYVDNRLMSLQLVSQGLTDAV